MLKSCQTTIFGRSIMHRKLRDEEEVMWHSVRLLPTCCVCVESQNILAVMPERDEHHIKPQMDPSCQIIATASSLPLVHKLVQSMQYSVNHSCFSDGEERHHQFHIARRADDPKALL
jgi:hypothetical protein